MVIKTEAWKDSRGKFHDSQEKAERADLITEIITLFWKQHAFSTSLNLLIEFIIDNYHITKKVKK